MIAPPRDGSIAQLSVRGIEESYAGTDAVTSDATRANGDLRLQRTGWSGPFLFSIGLGVNDRDCSRPVFRRRGAMVSARSTRSGCTRGREAWTWWFSAARTTPLWRSSSRAVWAPPGGQTGAPRFTAVVHPCGHLPSRQRVDDVVEGRTGDVHPPTESGIAHLSPFPEGSRAIVREPTAPRLRCRPAGRSSGRLAWSSEASPHEGRSGTARYRKPWAA